jgi:hypothetical protein
VSPRQIRHRRGGFFPTHSGFVAVKLDGVIYTAFAKEEQKKTFPILICHGLAYLRKAGNLGVSAGFLVGNRDRVNGYRTGNANLRFAERVLGGKSAG